MSDEENTDGVEGAMMCEERLASRWEGVDRIEEDGAADGAAEVGKVDGMVTDICMGEC